jgi:SAM-dependent methyltransferase
MPSMQAPSNTVERIHPRFFNTREKYLLYLRHVFAYEYAVDHLDAASNVLEIGCGDGYGTTMLAEKVARIVAVDVDEGTVQHAAATYPAENCTFQPFDGETLPFDTGTFDAVVSMQVIEHIQDDRRFVGEAHRVLKQGGVLILTTPNRRHRVPPGEPIWNKFHVREYLPGELEAVLRSHFDEVQVLGIRGHPDAQRIEIERVRRGLTLRKCLPEFVRRWIDGDVTARYSTADFHVTADEPEDGLDLLGVCVK